MQHQNLFSNKASATDWQILGELESSAMSSVNETISAWLTQTLIPLDLHVDFLTKVLKSAQDAATHIQQAEAATKLEHIHLLIFVPLDYTSKGRSWGFFRIEKIESATTDKTFPDHAIEFYLYLEGQ